MKNFWEKYVAYLKDNPEGYWFKAKLYGWGWTPATREGWLITLTAVGVVIWHAVRFENSGLPESAVIDEVLIPTAAVVVALLVVCVWKGEPARWRWGFEDGEDKDSNDR